MSEYKMHTVDTIYGVRIDPLTWQDIWNTTTTFVCLYVCMYACVGSKIWNQWFQDEEEEQQASSSSCPSNCRVLPV